MSMDTVHFDLKITPGALPPVLHLSQYDTGRTFVAHLKDEDGNAYEAPGATAKFAGKNRLGQVWDITCDVSGDEVTFTPSGAATSQYGKYAATITLNDDGELLTPLNIILDVQRAGATEEDIASSPDLPDVVQEAVDNYLDEHLLPDEVLRVAITYSGGSYSCDTALADIAAAYTAQKVVIADTPDGRAYCTLATSTEATFVTFDSSGGAPLHILYEIGPGGITQTTTPIGGSSGSGLSDDIKYALLDLLAHVGYEGTDGQDYYDALEAALFAGPALVSISAVFEQDDTIIYSDASLNDLKPMLTVRASYDDGSSNIVEAYTLSGDLVVGTSAITVSYGGKTATFNVVVTQGLPSGYTGYDYIQRYTDSGSLNAAPNSQIRLKTYTNLNALSTEFAYCALAGHTAGFNIWGRRDGTGSTKSYAFYAGDGDLGFHIHGTDSQPYKPEATNGEVHIAKLINSDESPSYLSVDDGTSVAIPWTNNNTLNLDPCLLTNAWDNASSATISHQIQVGYIKFFDLNGAMVGYYRPAVRDADGVIGMFDIVEQTFYTTSATDYAKIGHTSQRYKIGNWS